MITSHLPSLSARYASRTLQFQLDPSMEMNGKIWNAVFQNPSWINKLTTQHQGDPILLGASIEDIACGRLLWSSFSKHPRWVLLTGYAQQREFEKDLFLRCLQPHTYYEDLNEVHFTTGLVLNIQDVVFHSAQEIRLKPMELFSSRGFGSKYVLLAVNTKSTKIHGYSAAKIMLGFEPKHVHFDIEPLLLLDLKQAEQELPPNQHQILSAMLDESRLLASEAASCTHGFSKRVQRRQRVPEPGDLVLVRIVALHTQHGRKLEARWPGPRMLVRYTNTKQVLSRVDKEYKISKSGMPFKLLTISEDHSGKITLSTHCEQMNKRLEIVATIGEELRGESIPWAAALKNEWKDLEREQGLVAGVAKHHIEVLYTSVTGYEESALKDNDEATASQPGPGASAPNATTLLRFTSTTSRGPSAPMPAIL